MPMARCKELYKFDNFWITQCDFNKLDYLITPSLPNDIQGSPLSFAVHTNFEFRINDAECTRYFYGHGGYSFSPSPEATLLSLTESGIYICISAPAGDKISGTPEILNTEVTKLVQNKYLFIASGSVVIDDITYNSTKILELSEEKTVLSLEDDTLIVPFDVVEI